MPPIEEDLVNVIWIKVSEGPPEDTLTAMQAFRDEQPTLFSWLTAPAESTNERLVEVILYLGVTLAQVFAWRRLPPGPLAPPMVDAVMLTRWSEKRTGTVASFLAGKQAQATTLPEALEMLVSRFDLPQLPMLSHATEALLVAHEDSDLTRTEVEHCFVRLLVLVDCLDRVVKS